MSQLRHRHHKRLYPGSPGSHYLCGGILVDLNAQSSIERLYAVGECSCTGLHGGNRLASNSLIEAVVYADAAARHTLEVIDRYTYNEEIPEWNDEGTRSPEEMVTDYPKHERGKPDNEYLRGYRPQRPPAQTRMGSFGHPL